MPPFKLDLAESGAYRFFEVDGAKEAGLLLLRREDGMLTWSMMVAATRSPDRRF